MSVRIVGPYAACEPRSCTGLAVGDCLQLGCEVEQFTCSLGGIRNIAYAGMVGLLHCMIHETQCAISVEHFEAFAKTQCCRLPAQNSAGQRMHGPDPGLAVAARDTHTGAKIVRGLVGIGTSEDLEAR